MSDAPSICFVGASGRTGSAVLQQLVARDDMKVVAAISPSLASNQTRPQWLPDAVAIFPDTAAAANSTVTWNVMVDLGVAEALETNLNAALGMGAHAIVGTTGFDDDLLESYAEKFAEQGLVLFHVSNFAIGAVLMMKCLAEMAQQRPDITVVESHHHTKLDAPSGTAISTARRIAAVRGEDGNQHNGCFDIDGVPVHSIRMRGAVAHQEVIAGNVGEILTVRHDAIDRSCYAAGVALAVRKVGALTGGLHHGLEKIL